MTEQQMIYEIAKSRLIDSNENSASQVVKFYSEALRLSYEILQRDTKAAAWQMHQSVSFEMDSLTLEILEGLGD